MQSRSTAQLRHTEQESVSPETPPVNSGDRNSADSEQRIRERAYELYVARGCHDGHADEDWRLAEEEILGITGGG
jgi:Protein of unknown function (DUF2934)